MSDQIRAIAMRIHEMREICGYSVSELAAQLDVTEAAYKAMESGEVDIPIGFLTQVAPLLGVDVSELLTGIQAHSQAYSLVRKGKGSMVQRNPKYAYKSLALGFQNKTIEPFLVKVLPDDPDAPIALNSHDGQEFDMVLEGILKLHIHGKDVIMYAGDCIYFDSSSPHGMKAIGENPVRFLALVIPSIEELVKRHK